MASARPASEGLGRQQESRDGQSRFVIPPAVLCDDVPSPSQHRLSFASQRRQAGLDSFSHEQDQDDAYSSEDEEDEGDVEASNSSGGEEEQEEEEEDEECENSEEEEEDGDASEVAFSRPSSKQLSSKDHLSKLVRNLQKEVAYLKSTSQAHPVDALSAPNLHKRRRFRSPSVEDDEEASGFIDSFLSDHGYETDSAWESAQLRTPRKRVQPKFRFIASRYTDRSTPDEIKTWLTTIANESMALTGQYSNVLSKPEDMGPFKKAHVRFVIYESFSTCVVLCVLTCYVSFFLGLPFGIRRVYAS